MTFPSAEKQRAACEMGIGQALTMSYMAALLIEHVIYNAVSHAD